MKCALQNETEIVDVLLFSGGEKRKVILPTSLYLVRDSVIFNVAVLF